MADEAEDTSRYAYKRVADRVRRKRLLVGVTQEQAAQVAGITSQMFSRREQGKTPFEPRELDKIIDAWQACPGWPYTDEGEIIEWLAEKIGVQLPKGSAPPSSGKRRVRHLPSPD